MNPQKIVPIIMCGGSGAGVWPESRESLPKQFIRLIGDRSTFQLTLSMLLDSTHFEKPVILTNWDYRFYVSEQIAELGTDAKIVLEPLHVDSAVAVAVAAEIVASESPDAVVGIFAADHLIEAQEAFVDLCARGAEVASNGYIVAFGSKPSYPSSRFGYIRPGKQIAPQSAARDISSFVEKPNANVAAEYVAEGYLWNSGTLLFRPGVMLEEMRKFCDGLVECARVAIKSGLTELGMFKLEETALSRLPKLSIERAVLEKTQRAVVLPAEIGWTDVDDWEAVWDLSDRDEKGNSITGMGFIVESSNVHVRSPDILTAVVGLHDVIAVTTTDAILVLHRSQVARVKELVAQLKAANRTEASEHRRIYRPWGYSQSVDRGGRYQVKRIVVKPGGRLSLQRHFHRAEHWVIVRGTAEVTLNDTVTIVHENESAFLPIGAVHRLSNPGKIDLELIEVQTGSYLAEDDIVRLDDVYNRL